MYFDDFLGRIRKEEPPSMVLLFGDSESSISEGSQTLRQKFSKSNPGGTQEVFDGTGDSLGEVLDAARTSGLFSTSQLLVLKNAGKVLGGHSEKNVEQLKEYFKNPSPGTFLVFLAPGLRKTTKAVAAVERLGWAVQCSEMPDWKIAGWLKQRAQEEGIQLGEDGAQALHQKVGPDLAFLQRALEQLALYVYPRKTATALEVRDLPAPGMESEIFAFLDAVGSRKTEAALKSLSQLGDGADAGTVILLYGRMRELLGIALGREKGHSQSLLAEKMGLHPFRVKMLWDQAGQFTPEELKGAMMDLIHLQAGVVTGRLGKRVPQVWLEWWLLKWGKNRMASRGKAIR